ncbi:MAG: DegT/DnrJ/EryC1/StrS family aminotransferase [Polyangia bacterium]|jgi:dTDP-4-amino-4,6-dideoxygalactose transaminase|nr:DegT/DnrJ/EryC1/StrS family aminotransferase [Polyangia bacterium]
MPDSQVPLLSLDRQLAALRPELDAAIARVIASGRFILGPEVEAFEEEAARRLGVAHAVGVASGTDAIWLALKALGLGPGDLVLTSPFTFFATASAIAGTGARAVFADIDPRSYNLDPEAAREVLSGRCPVARRLGLDPRRIRALLPVHLYGQAADLDALGTLADACGLALVEDAAQAMGAAWQGAPIGRTRGQACFSFFPSKNLGALGDGGLVTTGDRTLAERLRLLRAHGATAKYQHGLLGTNSRLDALQAAILSVKLPRLSAWVEARRSHAAAYDEAFAALPGIEPPFADPRGSHSYHQYTIRATGGRREALAAHLASRGIGHAIYYPVPLHMQEALVPLGYLPGDFPRAETAAAQVLSLPIFPELSTEERERVVAAVTSFAHGFGP